MHDQATKRYLTICWTVLVSMILMGSSLLPIESSETSPRITQVPYDRDDCVRHVCNEMTLADMSTFRYEWRGDRLHWKVKTSWNDTFRTDSALFPGVSRGLYTHDTTRWYVY